MDVLSYKCPACGAGLEFEIKTQAWDCKYCHTSFTLGELQKLRDGARARGAEKPSFEPASVSAYRCPSCGGEIIAEKNTAATFCLYCHNPTIIPAQLSDKYRPDYILPFKLPKEKTVEILRKVCKRKPFLPGVFRRSVENGETGGLYVPFWLFSSDADGYLEAEADRVTSWSDSRYRYTKTDTYRVVRDAGMALRHVPVDASDRMDDAMMQAIEPFSYEDMVDFSMEYLSGHYAESYDTAAEKAESTGRARMDDAVRSVMRGLVGGYSSVRVRILNVNLRGVTHKYAMLPVWTFVCRYREKLYRYAVNGQTGKVTGKLPVSPAKVAAWVSGILAGSVLLAGLIFAVGGAVAV